MTATIAFAFEVRPVEEIVFDAVCLFYGITKEDLKNNHQNGEAAYRRHMCYYLLKNNSFFGISEIARMFDTRHSTIQFGVNKICDLVSYDKRVIKERKEIQLIIDNFKDNQLKWLIPNNN